jgi:hypothetical protein
VAGWGGRGGGGSRGWRGGGGFGRVWRWPIRAQAEPVVWIPESRPPGVRGEPRSAHANEQALLHGLRAWDPTLLAAGRAHRDVHGARRAGQVGDARAGHQRGDLLARQRDGRDDGAQLAIDGALLLLRAQSYSELLRAQSRLWVRCNSCTKSLNRAVGDPIVRPPNMAGVKADATAAIATGAQDATPSSSGRPHTLVPIFIHADPSATNPVEIRQASSCAAGLSCGANWRARAPGAHACMRTFLTASVPPPPHRRPAPTLPCSERALARRQPRVGQRPGGGAAACVRAAWSARQVRTHAWGARGSAGARAGGGVVREGAWVGHGTAPSGKRLVLHNCTHAGR